MPTHTATYLYEPDSFIPLAQLTAGFDHTALAATGTDRQPLRCYQTQTATLYYFQTDHLGTPQDITDTDGHIVWSGQYRAWGQLTQAHNGQGENPNIHNPFRFQGQYHDPETGLHYNRFRYYDPRIGRFTTQDPIGLMGGENLYQYAPNPTGWIDPLGLAKLFEIGTYGELTSKEHVGDNLQAHEMLRHEYLVQEGLTSKSKRHPDNPSIALDLDHHTRGPSRDTRGVGGVHHHEAQIRKSMGLGRNEFSSSVDTEINISSTAMKRAGIPEETVNALGQRARDFHSSLISKKRSCRCS